jgi:hypothetical protein
MTHDVAFAEPDYGYVRDRVEPAGDLGKPGEPIEETTSRPWLQPGSARRSPSALCDERLPISIPDPNPS